MGVPWGSTASSQPGGRAVGISTEDAGGEGEGAVDCALGTHDVCCVYML